MLAYIHRLSPTELLKLPFYKKAKSKEFVKEVVLGDAPNLQSRAKKVKFATARSPLPHHPPSIYLLG